MKKILIATSSFDVNNFEQIDILKSNNFEIVFNPFDKRLNEVEIFNLLDNDVVGVIAGLEKYNYNILNKAKFLKVISRCGIGLDNIDLDTANKLGISVYNTPDAPTRAVAELTIAHIFSILRRISESDREIKAGQWKPLMGSLLNKQTIGIVGYGRVGKMVASFLKPFGSKVISYDPVIKNNNDNVEMVSFEKLLLESDIVTLHIPYSQQNHHIINDIALKKMKQNAFLVNIARGGLIDEIALLDVLKDNKLSGVSLDCFEEEPYTGPLLSINKVQVTAHMGSYAKEARMMMESEACANLVKGLRNNGLLL